MPCNQLAVKTAQVTMNETLMRGIFSNAAALAVLRQTMATVQGVPVGAVSIWNDRNYWGNGYGARYTPDHQVIPLERIADANAGYLDIASEAICIRLFPDGRIEARDGWRLGYRPPQSEAWIEALKTALAQIGVIVAQNMIAEALRAAGVAIVSDEVTAQARIMTVEV